MSPSSPALEFAPAVTTGASAHAQCLGFALSRVEIPAYEGGSRVRGWRIEACRCAEMYKSAVSASRLGSMNETTISDARARLADLIDAARVDHEPVYLTRRGRRVAAVIDADDLDRLIAAAEDLADIEAARSARQEIADGDAAIPWELVKADLGLA